MVSASNALYQSFYPSDGSKKAQMTYNGAEFQSLASFTDHVRVSLDQAGFPESRVFHKTRLGIAQFTAFDHSNLEPLPKL